MPDALLRAITIVETGRGAGRDPWPWTINSQGKGHWFATRAEAESFARSEIAAGRDQFDIGCFQMNVRWHSRRFASVEAMFDPLANARRAAEFLRELHAEKGSWTEAAAAYHSRDPDLARAYLERVAGIVGQAPAAGAETTRVAAAEAAPAPRLNRYPLLTGGAAGGRGSLVPVTPGRGRLIGGG